MVKEKLKNRAQFGNNSSPKKPNDALCYVQNYKTHGGRYRGGKVQHTKQEGVAIIQTGKKSGGVHKGRDILTKNYFNCGKKAHHSKDCPELTEDEKPQIGDGMAELNTISNKIGNKNCDDMSQYSGDSDDRMLEGVGSIEVGRKTASCDRHKCYLESCTTNHKMYVNSWQMYISWPSN